MNCVKFFENIYKIKNTFLTSTYLINNIICNYFYYILIIALICELIICLSVLSIIDFIKKISTEDYDSININKDYIYHELFNIKKYKRKIQIYKKCFLKHSNTNSYLSLKINLEKYKKIIKNL